MKHYITDCPAFVFVCSIDMAWPQNLQILGPGPKLVASFGAWPNQLARGAEKNPFLEGFELGCRDEYCVQEYFDFRQSTGAQ